MTAVMPRITASLLYSHLSCPHRVAMDATADPALRDPVSPFVQMLWERGTLHERRHAVAAGGVERMVQEAYLPVRP